MVNATLVSASDSVLWSGTGPVTVPLAVPGHLLEVGTMRIDAIMTTSEATDTRVARLAMQVDVLDPSEHPAMPLVLLKAGKFVDTSAFVVTRSLVLDVDVVDSSDCNSWSWQWSVDRILSDGSAVALQELGVLALSALSGVVRPTSARVT